jgi:hypothetical protein
MKKLQATLVCLVAFSGIPLSAQSVPYWDTKLQAFQVETEPVSLMAGDSSASLPLNATVNIQQ